MKALKYLAIGVLLTIVSAPAMAQLDGKAAVEEVKNILKSGAPDANKRIADIAKPFKKDAVVLTAIGREYLIADDTEKATEYANNAISKNKSYGEAYILLGDIAIHNDDGGKAAEMFQQAMYMDKTNPEGYRRYANLMVKSSPEASIDALEQLHKNIPGYPIDLIAAEVSDRSGNMQQAIEYFGKVSLSEMKEDQLASYATDLFLTGDYNKSLEVAQYGVKKAPRYAAFNRLSLYNYTENKEFDKALYYADKLFNESDSAKFSAFDYQYVGHANVGAKNYAVAIETFNKILTLEDANDDAKLDALKQISTAYSDQDDYENAIPAYEKYLAANTNATASDYAALGTLYTYKASEEEGLTQEATVAQADKVYADLAEKFPDAQEYAYFQRARLAGMIDPDLSKGAAKPYYDKLIEVIEADGTPEGTSLTRLIQAYQYNMIYALQVLDDIDASKRYAAKVLEYDPENEQAKLVQTLE
ncbi:MAG: hypothetical protein LUC26_03640 [Prevotella sp.]|nr:hypothetical protein [Prevotella sp.]